MKLRLSRFIALVTICMTCQTAFAQRNLKEIPVPDPELERATLKLPEGFEINLFAADPQIAKPIQMNFDPQGRLWIASSEVYPQIAPGQKANDKILVLEDTNGDGVADKTTVFADGLLIPTGVEPGDGGVYVANSTELLHLSDTNGDGKADRSRVVLSGFGTEDTHHILHTFRWGHDGLLYMNQSIYIHSHVDTPFGVRRLNAGGIWQFRPETGKLEVFARGWINTWGHHFDRWGQSFATDGAGGEGINFVIPGAAYPAATGLPRIFHGLNPGSPKYCGLEMVDGRHLPDDWQGNLITHDFRGHRVCRFILSDDGSGFAARQQADLVKSDHAAFRPIDVKMGPDGAIYIADWYNPIIQHGEVDFRDPRRDHTHGRIWRITAKNRPLVERPQFAGKAVPELLEMLKSPESYTRHQAKRVIKEIGQHDSSKVLPFLHDWLTKLDPKQADFEHQRLEGLWVTQAVDAVNESLLDQVLKSPDPRARSAGVHVISQWADRLPNAHSKLEIAMADSHPRVRLEAVRSLTAIPSSRSAEVALRAIDKQPLDQFLEYGLWLTLFELQPQWLPAVLDGSFNFEGKLARLVHAAKVTNRPELVPAIVKLWQAGQIPAESRGTVLEIIGGLGSPDDLRFVLNSAIDSQKSGADVDPLLRTLLTAKQKRNTQPAGDLTTVWQLYEAGSPTTKRLAVEAAALWNQKGLADRILKIAQDRNADVGLRQTAITSVAALTGHTAVEPLAGLSRGQEDAEPVRVAALEGIARVEPKTEVVAELIRNYLMTSRNAAAQQQLFQSFLQRKDGAALLVQAIGTQKLAEDTAKVGLRAVASAGRPEPKLTDVLTQSAGLTGGPKILTEAEMSEWVQAVKTTGNPDHGEALFRRAELNCFKCHALGGAGGRLGPDLSSIGSSAQVDYLVDSLLNPNKAVKEGFHSVVVTTNQGKVHTGIKLRQTDTDLILRDPEDREVAIPLKSIDEQAPGVSLMPAGLTDKLTKQELIDLVRFISELGKPGNFSVGTARVARKWEVLQPTGEAYTRLSRTSDTEAMRGDAGMTWIPSYAKTNGELPIAELPQFTQKRVLEQTERKVSFVRTRLTVSTAGKVGLKLEDTTSLQVWLDGQPIDVKSDLALQLSVGEHLLCISVEPPLAKRNLRVQLVDLPGESSQAQFVLGK